MLKGLVTLKRSLGLKHIKTLQNRTIVAYNEAVKIGILFDATDPLTAATVRDFSDFLKNDGKKIQLFGYVNARELQKDLNQNLQVGYFSNKDTDWRGIPISNSIQYFLNQEFDILINCHLNTALPLIFAGKMSAAKYRIGFYAEEFSKEISDVMLNLPNTKNIESLIAAFKHYFNFIK